MIRYTDDAEEYEPIPRLICHCCDATIVEDEGGEIPDEGRACQDCFAEWQESERAWKSREADAIAAGRREQEAS